MEHDDLLASYRAERKKKRDKAQSTLDPRKEKIRTSLQILKVTKVISTYDGEGDSGSIESTEFVEDKGLINVVDNTLKEEVENLLYDMLSHRWGGWENNEGAFGSFIWDLATNEITHQHNMRVMSHEEHMSTGWNLEAEGE